MSRTAQVRFSAAMDADLEVILKEAKNLGMDASLSGMVRVALRQLRMRLEAGQPLIEESKVRIKEVVEPVPERSAAKAPWTAKEDAMLGKAADSAIGAKLGRSLEAVGNRRRALKIPPFNAVAKPKPKAKSRKT